MKEYLIVIHDREFYIEGHEIKFGECLEIIKDGEVIAFFKEYIGWTVRKK